jgi:hypothetical protein
MNSRSTEGEITRRRKELEVDRDELTGRIERIESIEGRKAYVREILGLYREMVKKAGEDPPLRLKRQLLEMLVDTVWVNDQTMMTRIDGVIPSTVDIMETLFELQLTRKWRHKRYQHNLPFYMVVELQKKDQG